MSPTTAPYLLSQVVSRAAPASSTHNFLSLDDERPGKGVVITMPYVIKTPQGKPNATLARVSGRQVRYLKTLESDDVVTAPLGGFGETAADNHIRIDNAKLGAGMAIVGDRPLLSANLWSIRTTIAVEPRVAVVVAPGSTFNWSSTYSYYTL